MRLPADILPMKPVLAYGTKQLTTAPFASTALAVYNNSTVVSTFNFGATYDISNTALDAHIGANYGRVTGWYEQMGGYNSAATLAQAFKIQDLAGGNARSLVCEGGSNSGALFGMVLPDISALGLTPAGITVIALINPVVSIARNQEGGAADTIGTVISLEGAGGSVLQLYADGLDGKRTAWAMRDNSAFTFSPTDTMIEIGPQVVAWSMGAGEPSCIRANGVVRTVDDRSALTAPIVTGYIGKRGNSAAGANSECGQFLYDAVLIYNYRLNQRQIADVEQSFLTHYNILTSRRSAYNIITMGDSIYSGFVGLGTFGVIPRLKQTFPQVRFGNFAVAGIQTTTWPGSGQSAKHYIEGLFPTAMLPNVSYSKVKNGLLMAPSGNDYARVPLLNFDNQTGNFTVGQVVTGATSGATFTIRAITDNGTTGIITPVRSTIVGTFQDNEIITDPMGGSATANGIVDPPAAVPSVVYAARLAMITAARAALSPATLKVWWLTHTNRYDPGLTGYQDLLDAENVLVRNGAAANNYTVIDMALDPILSVTPPGTCYNFDDYVHPNTTIGHVRMEVITRPYITAWLAE